MNLKNLKYVLAFGMGVVAATLTAAETTSVEDRLNQLEKTVQSLQKENADLKTQLGWDTKTQKLPVTVKPAGKESKLSLGGYIQGQAEFGDAADARYTGIEDRILVRRARLTATGSFAENFDFKLEGDFGANSCSEKTNYNAQLTDICINWTRYAFANVKVGQFKTPFGYEQLMADPKYITIERSLANDRLTDSRQIGLGVSGDFFGKRLGYSVGAFNGTAVNNSFNDNDNFMFAGRLQGTPVVAKIGNEDLRWSAGVNGLSTHDAGITRSGFGFTGNSFTGERYGLGVDTQLKWWLFGLEAEYLRNHFEPANSVPTGTFNAAGWYVCATAFVLPKKLQTVVKFEQFDPRLGVSGNTSDTWTVGLNYYLKGDDLKLSANYLFGNPAGQPDGQNRFLTRLQVVF
jgi:phosphate-selective porin OprO and OprP